MIVGRIYLLALVVAAPVADAADLVVRTLAVASVESHRTPSHPGAHGLSVYLPGRGAGMDHDYAAPAAPWSSNRWAELLARFTAE
jgi:hypothetical protein